MDYKNFQPLSTDNHSFVKFTSLSDNDEQTKQQIGKCKNWTLTGYKEIQSGKRLLKFK